MMRAIGLLALLLAVVYGGAAIAQTGNKGNEAIGQTITGGIPEAPIGHRQPRASGVPDEKNLGNPNNPVNKEDAALDRKIKSICRGC
jgi:hypothetical protein